MSQPLDHTVNIVFGNLATQFVTTFYEFLAYPGIVVYQLLAMIDNSDLLPAQLSCLLPVRASA